jgi:hypothetical protein
VIAARPSERWDGRERRKAPRFSVALAVSLDDAKGCTRDVSATGVFFTAQNALAVGAPITFAFQLEHADPSGVLHVACDGTVLRIEPEREAFGVAVRITAYGVDGQDGAVKPVGGNSGV